MRQRISTRHVQRTTTLRPARVAPFGVVLTLSTVLLAAPAWAQEEPNAADVSAARALGQDGVKLADAGNCPEAIDKLGRAEKMFHAPTTLARLGECQVLTGKLVDGTENLNRVIREVLPANAPPAFQAAQERAKKVLAEAKPKIAKLKIAVAAPADAQVAVKIDGEPVPLANLNTNRPMDPGEHVVEAAEPGYRPASARVKLTEGGVDSVALTLEPDPNAPKAGAGAAAGSTSAPQQTGPAADSGGGSRAPGYVVLGVGAVGLGVGAVFGVLALGKKSDLDGLCTAEKTCTSNAQDTIDSGQTLATVSTIGFGVGIVGVAVGTYLLLTSGGSSASSARAAKAALTPSRGLRVQPVVGTDRVGLSGTL